MKDFRVKDFTIKPIYVGSRLQGGPQYGYAIYYNTPSGKSVRLNKTCYTKKAANEYIRQTIKLASAMRENKIKETKKGEAI